MPEHVLRDAVAEEEAAGFDGGTCERSADAAVEAGKAVAADGLAEAVEGAAVLGMALGLQADFDGVERILDGFANDTSELQLVREWKASSGRGKGGQAYGAIADIFESFEGLVF